MSRSFVSPRRSVLAGTWYPGSAEHLLQDVKRYCECARQVEFEGSPLGLIVPHAGYAYSGSCAGYGYRVFERAHPRRVVIIGPSHRDSFAGVALPDVDAFETPLGAMPVDANAIALLRAREPFVVRAAAHGTEHCIEIQLPFLQRFLPDATIVPLVVGHVDAVGKRLAAAGLRALLDGDTFFVVSSDFTHYGEAFGYLPFPPQGDVRARLEELDGHAIDAISRRDIEALVAHCGKVDATICGVAPIEILLRALEGADVKARLLKYDTSGDSTGDWRHCVAYATMLFEDLGRIDAEAGRLLLRLARNAIVRALGLAGEVGPPKTPLPACIARPAGAFVTIKRHGRLRGCIGHLTSERPLHAVVTEVAVLAATEDARFEPVRQEEVSDLQVEVSVLSKPVPVADEREVVVGHDGLIAEWGGFRGTLLPQVAVEHHLDREAFIEATLAKARIPTEGTVRSQVKLQRYAAQVVREAGHES
ncbi:MAG: AmmeMemoRadiSam system protein B [Planctomycetota bacterium]